MIELSSESDLNKIYRDKYGRTSALLAIDKSAGVTSHDIVDEVRRIVGTRKVGHAGALDPFATGLLIVLVGKFTKKTDSFITLDKSYNAEIVLGVGSDSHDIEGQIENIEANLNISEREIKEAIQSFNGKYLQYVPVFSSVKVNGMKLRELARSSSKFEIKDTAGQKSVVFEIAEDAKGKFKQKVENGKIEVRLPSKEVTTNIVVNSIRVLSGKELDLLDLAGNKDNKFIVVNVDVDCSKGTYIRQLAADIGAKLSTYGSLYSLRRTRIGQISIDQAIVLEDLVNL